MTTDFIIGDSFLIRKKIADFLAQFQKERSFCPPHLRRALFSGDLNQKMFFSSEPLSKSSLEDSKVCFSAEQPANSVSKIQKDKAVLALSRPIKALVIGASTGGPKAILQLVQALPKKLTFPVFIVQHMPKGFTTSFAKRLNEQTAAVVKEAVHGMSIKNEVYLCPGDFHMTVLFGKICLDQKPKLHGTRPAVDHLFISAAHLFRQNLAAFLLTGMGKDGTSGMKEVQKYGGVTIAQSEESCVVFGMPKNAIKEHAVTAVLSLEEMTQIIGQIVR